MAAFGRDTYRSTKKNLLVIAAIAAAAVLPFLGARRMVRGYRTGGGAIWGALSGTVLLAIGLLPALVFGAIAASQGSGGDAFPALAFLFFGAISGISTLGGGIAGLVGRGKRFRMFQVEDANLAFLEANGITASEGDDVHYFDAQGNALRVIEATQEAVILMPIGTRNKRAYITITKDGEMLEYSGVVHISEGARYAGTSTAPAAA